VGRQISCFNAFVSRPLQSRPQRPAIAIAIFHFVQHFLLEKQPSFINLTKDPFLLPSSPFALYLSCYSSYLPQLGEETLECLATLVHKETWERQVLPVLQALRG
jgi:hypothetical protein